MSDVKRYEHCFVCDDLTGKAGRADDSLYINSVGPFCENCYDERLVQCAESVDADPAALTAAQARCERLEEAVEEVRAYCEPLAWMRTDPGYDEGRGDVASKVMSLLAPLLTTPERTAPPQGEERES
jgi:hypothetical protein